LATVERLGKGLRGPPRDAWLASITPRSARGRAFGVHKALDKAGAVIGPLLAYALLSRLGPGVEGYRTLFWIAFVPAVAGVALLAGVKDRPAAPVATVDLGASWRALSPGFRRFLVPAGVFALGYYSLGFLLLQAHASGFDVGETVLLYALFNAVCVLAAPIAGRLGDRHGRGRVVVLGYALYLVVNLGLLVADSRWQVVALFVVYGLFYAIDESQGRAFVADLEPRQRATAQGLHQLVTGAIYLPASLLAGALWLLAPAAAFGAAALLSALAIACFVALRPSS
jgi:MFS family permease